MSVFGIELVDEHFILTWFTRPEPFLVFRGIVATEASFSALLPSQVMVLY